MGAPLLLLLEVAAGFGPGGKKATAAPPPPPLITEEMMVAVGAALAVLARFVFLPQDLETGRDLLLLLVALQSMLLGLVPGLVAGVTARALSIWWLTVPGVPSVIQPWNHLGVATILLVTIVAASLAGKAILLLAEREEDPPR